MKRHVLDFCKLYNITENQFYGREEINGDLYLRSLKSAPEGFNPTVGGDLYLSSLESAPEGFNPTVGGDLDLSSLESAPEGFNPTVGGDLDLSSLKSAPEGFNPTVGGSLYLSSLESAPEGFNPTVGGYLDLSSLKSAPEGFNPTVGGYLEWKHGRKYIGANVNIPHTSIRLPEVYTWQNGQYIKADGIFMEVISKRGNIYRVRKINKENITYLVTDGHGKWSHGKTLKEAKDDLVFKISNRDKSEYKVLGKESVLTYEKAIEAYRVITGACSFGTRNFVANRLQKKKDRYSINEIIALTAGEYGHETFKSFFN